MNHGLGFPIEPRDCGFRLAVGLLVRGVGVVRFVVVAVLLRG